MVWGWLIPCPFVLCVAASLAELTSAMPYVASPWITSLLTEPYEGRALGYTTFLPSWLHLSMSRWLAGSLGGRT